MRMMEKEKKKDLMFLTLIVIVFALFFVTFILLNNAETRCFERFDNAMLVISEDPCMSQCINPVIMNSLNYTIGGMQYETQPKRP
jgi:ABC-type thiamin/hydroxymethylpyrimidine transport system permease subunit